MLATTTPTIEGKRITKDVYKRQAPEPWQWSHVTYFFSLNFFSTPVEISFKFSFTFTRRSEPCLLYTSRCV